MLLTVKPSSPSQTPQHARAHKKDSQQVSFFRLRLLAVTARTSKQQPQHQMRTLASTMTKIIHQLSPVGRGGSPEISSGGVDTIVGKGDGIDVGEGVPPTGGSGPGSGSG